MEEFFSAAMARETAGVDGNGSPARLAAIAPPANRIDEELSRAPVDDYFILILLSCLWGACHTLQLFCDGIEDPSQAVDNAPALSLVARVSDPDAAERALRVVTCAMAARILTLTWPERWEEVLDVGRAAMPVDDDDYYDIRQLAAVTAEELQPIADDDPRHEEDIKAGRWFTFSGDSLRLAIEAATGMRPTPVGLLFVTSFWGECVADGISVLRIRLDELEATNAGLAP